MEIGDHMPSHTRNASWLQPVTKMFGALTEKLPDFQDIVLAVDDYRESELDYIQRQNQKNKVSKTALN
jgi:hypothetical protein